MPNGKLFGYNKLTDAQFEIGAIAGRFSLEENINESPSNMKVKVVNTTREEYEVNTVCYHQDFDTWWVIKKDESTLLGNGDYEHEIDLVEYFEFLNYRHLTDCAFKKDKYTFKTMIERILKLGKVSSFSVEYPTFLDENKKNEFFAFENFTVASAIKAVARSVNAIPRLKRKLISSVLTPTIYFVSRNGLDETPRTNIDTIFPNKFEKNSNSADQFQTRSISNLQNVLASDLVVAPKLGGYVSITKDESALDTTSGNAVVVLPSPIDRVEYIKLFPRIKVERYYLFKSTSAVTRNTIYEGYYTDSVKIKERVDAKTDTAGSPIVYQQITNGNIASILYPSTEDFGKISINDGIGNSYKVATKPFAGYLTLKDEIGYTLTTSTTFSTPDKDKTFYYKQKSNELVCAKNFIKGLSSLDFNQYVPLFTYDSATETEIIQIVVIVETTTLFGTPVMRPNTTYIQTAYVPIGDLKVSYDNDNDAQDEKYFNQSGKLLDAYASTKLILSHVNDSIEGTKIRMAKHTSLNDVLPLGALISDGGIIYVVNQRSIDYLNGFYSVIYNLSRNRIARSENITADGSIRDYQIPQNNNVRRNQLYKDYLELSLEPSVTGSTTPYLPLQKALAFTSAYAGTRFDYSTYAKLTHSATTKRVGVSTSYYDLFKSKVLVCDFMYNAIIGYRSEEVSGVVVQTPIFYTGTETLNGNTVSKGETTDIELTITDEKELAEAIEHLKANYTKTNENYYPFIDLTNIDSDFYDTSLNSQGNYIFKITETGYAKDPYEIPVFTYQVQGNDNIQVNNSVILGDRLFSDFKKSTTTTDVIYTYTLSNTRFTSENGDGQYSSTDGTTRRVLVTRTADRQIDLTLYSYYAPPSTTYNSTTIKHVGFYAQYFDGSVWQKKFLFAINDYNKTSQYAISVYLNNYKI